MISYKGKLSVLAALPMFGQLVATLDIPGLTAEVAALLQASVTFTPPSIIGIGAVVAAIGAAISAGFQPPVFDFAGNFIVKYNLLKVKLELIIEITDLLASGSLRVYEYEGTAGAFGGELTATLAGPDADGGVTSSQSTFAVVLLAEGGTAGETTLRAIRAGV
jgi:hypothetical protein